MSAGRSRVPAYVALARSIFDHYLFQNNEPYSWREAWEYLFTHAAWRPDGKRMSRGIAVTARGQIAVTIRGLAKRWNWKRGSVEHFLRRLKEEGMIESVVIKTKIQTNNGARSSYDSTLITICNYEKFQSAAARGGGQRTGQSLRQENAELPGLIYAIASPTRLNNRTTESKVKRTSKGGGFARRDMPEHGKQSDGLTFCRYGTGDWQVYAADVEAVRGTKPIPTRYLDGCGNWFITAGEGASEATA